MNGLFECISRIIGLHRFLNKFPKTSLKHFRHLDYINDALDSGNICPACPKVIFI